MGQIYLEAQLTLIAAAGKDPTCGLAGVSRDRQSTSACEALGDLGTILTYPYSTASHIQSSLWFSRAWTLQEGYFSSRTLVFTDREVTYICNSNVSECDSWKREHESNRDLYSWRGARDAVCSSLGSDNADDEFEALSVTTSLLETYTVRDLSYDSDALNAIVGALNAMGNSGPPIHHIWGLPFTELRVRSLLLRRIPSLPSVHLSDEHLHLQQEALTEMNRAMARERMSDYGPMEWDTDSVSSDQSYEAEQKDRPRKAILALSWYHQSPATRRQGFPSWSPLGWKGGVTFSNHIVAVPQDCKIKITRDHPYQELQHEVAKPALDHFSWENSQYLEITVNTVQLDVEYMSREEAERVHDPTGLAKEGWYVRLSHSYLVLPFWDDEDLQLPTSSSLLYALVGSLDEIATSSSLSEPFSGIPHPTVLILQSLGAHYERIGWFHLNEPDVPVVKKAVSAYSGDVTYVFWDRGGWKWGREKQKHTILLG
jgi:hypothetical protein